MKIKCPECDTTYTVAPEVANGKTQVQCARCTTIFTALPWNEPETEGKTAPPPQPEPEPEETFDEAFSALAQAADEMENFSAEGFDEPANEPDKKANEDGDSELAGLLTEEEKAFLANFTSPDEKKEPAEKPEADPIKLSDIDIGWAEGEDGGPALDQSALDDLFDEPASAETEDGGPALDQSAPDDLFDEPASAEAEDGGPALDQSALDDLFDEPASAEAEDGGPALDQSALDDLFDEPASAEAEDGGPALDQSALDNLFDEPEGEEAETEAVVVSDDKSDADALASTLEGVPEEPETFNEIELKPLSEPPPKLTKTEKLARLKLKLHLSPTQIGWGSLAASLLLILTLGITFRVGITSAIPGMAGIYETVGLPVNVRGLEFLGLSHQWVEEDGRMRLVVRGEIVNITDESKPVPEVIFAMLDANGREFFQWTEQTKPDLLLPRARTRFRAQIPAPVDRVRQLQIRFAKR